MGRSMNDFLGNREVRFGILPVLYGKTFVNGHCLERKLSLMLFKDTSLAATPFIVLGHVG